MSPTTTKDSILAITTITTTTTTIITTKDSCPRQAIITTKVSTLSPHRPATTATTAIINTTEITGIMVAMPIITIMYITVIDRIHPKCCFISASFFRSGPIVHYPVLFKYKSALNLAQKIEYNIKFTRGLNKDGNNSQT